MIQDATDRLETGSENAVHHLISFVLNILLSFLPKKKRRRMYLIVRIILPLSLLAIIGLFVGVQWIGPKADGPTSDPLVRLNASAASLDGNAARLYQAALDARTDPPTASWREHDRRDERPLDATLAAWVEANAESFDLTRQATAISQCRFALVRGRSGNIDVRLMNPLRDQARFISIRARLAVERRDPDTLADSLLMLTAMAGHIATYPGVIGDLMGLSFRARAWDRLLEPFEWSELSRSTRRAYAIRLAAVLEALPDFADVLRAERDDLCWIVANSSLSDYKRYFPKRRVYAELDRVMRPAFDLARQSPEARGDPDNPLWAEMAEIRNWPAFGPAGLLNIPRLIAVTFASHARPMHMRIRGETTLRGLRTAIAILHYIDRTGQPPEALAVLAQSAGLSGGDSIDPLDPRDTIDPYTGAQFIYRTLDGGFTLYSAGIDRDDDGGAHNDRFGERGKYDSSHPVPPDGDYVFWPIPDASQDDD